MRAKRNITVALDDDLVDELEAMDGDLSGQLKAVLRSKLDRKRQQRLLGELLDALDAEHGPVDEALVEKYAELLQ